MNSSDWLNSLFPGKSRINRIAAKASRLQACLIILGLTTAFFSLSANDATTQPARSPSRPVSHADLDKRLFDAVYRGSITEAAQFLSQGANVLSEDNRGWTPLVLAAQSGNLEMVKLLVKNGADVNRQTSSKTGSTILSFACESDNLALLEFLIASGADVNRKARNGYTPLIFAASTGHREVARFLVKKGADPELFGPMDSGSATLNAFFGAATAGHVQILKDFLQRPGLNLEKRNSKGETLLMFSAKYPFPEVIELLLDQGADVNAKGPSGHTALIFAAYNGRIKTLEHLIARGADLSATATDHDDPNSAHRYGPERLARQQGHMEAYALLVRAQENRPSSPAPATSPEIYVTQKKFVNTLRPDKILKTVEDLRKHSPRNDAGGVLSTNLWPREFHQQSVIQAEWVDSGLLIVLEKTAKNQRGLFVSVDPNTPPDRPTGIELEELSPRIFAYSERASSSAESGRQPFILRGVAH